MRVTAILAERNHPGQRSTPCLLFLLPFASRTHIVRFTCNILICTCAHTSIVHARDAKKLERTRKKDFLYDFNSRKQRRERSCSGVEKTAGAHLRRNAFLSLSFSDLYIPFHLFMHKRARRAARHVCVWRKKLPVSRKKKNVRENANCPLDVSGKMFPDLACVSTSLLAFDKY